MCSVTFLKIEVIYLCVKDMRAVSFVVPNKTVWGLSL